MRPIDVVKRATLLGAAGYTLSTPVTEIYAHARNAHATVELSKSIEFVGWGISRLTGLDPTPWAIGHRIHHTEESRKPRNIVKAAAAAIMSGATSRQDAEDLLRNPENEKYLLFNNVPIDEDPVLRRDEKGVLQLRYKNKLDELLSSHPVGRYVGVTGLFLVFTATSQQKSVKEKSIDGFVKTAAFTTALYTPAFMGSAFFESLDGFNHGSEAGRDGGISAQVAWGNFALHRSHHEQPAKFTPDTPGVHRDRFVLQALTRIGLARER